MEVFLWLIGGAFFLYVFRLRGTLLLLGCVYVALYAWAYFDPYGTDAAQKHEDVTWRERCLAMPPAKQASDNFSDLDRYLCRPAPPRG